MAMLAVMGLRGGTERTVDVPRLVHAADVRADAIQGSAE
jgi:hypothetical protein